MKGADSEKECTFLRIYIYIPLLQVQGYMQRALCIWTIIFPLVVDDRRFAVCTIWTVLSRLSPFSFILDLPSSKSFEEQLYRVIPVIIPFEYIYIYIYGIPMHTFSLSNRLNDLNSQFSQHDLRITKLEISFFFFSFLLEFHSTRSLVITVCRLIER